MTIQKKIFNTLIQVVALSCILATIVQHTFAQTDVTVNAYNTSLFPFVYSNVSVRSGGNYVLDLVKDDFQVFENSTLQTEYFDVTPPAIGGGVRLADIVFLIDVSGSMGAEIADVRNNVNAFADALAASNIDFSLGLVRFGNSSGSNPYIFNSGNLTDDVALFQSFVNTLSASGGYEPGFLAIRQAIVGFNFRPGAQKVFLIITDEDSDDSNKQQTIDLLLANSITVHAAVDCSYGSSRSDYCDDTSIRGVTGGLLFSVRDAYSSILGTIVETSSSSYIVRYKSSNPNYDNTMRHVEVFATAYGEIDSDTFTYTPGAAPEIALSLSTEALLSNPPSEGLPLTISAVITDNITPYVMSATLYYKIETATTFQSISMINTYDNVWEGTIPANTVHHPGIEFYITATDGQTNSSLPKANPSSNPINIAVLPNELPVINHEPVPFAISGQEIEVIAEITDTTNYIETVKLFYRKLGEIQYQEISVSVGSGSYKFQEFIPADAVTIYGVEYYIEAIDNFGLSASFGTPDKPVLIGVGFVWQRITFDNTTYTVVIKVDQVPENPQEYVYPIFDGSRFLSEEPQAIAILDSNGNRVINSEIVNRILALARNASLYRYLANKPFDPFPLLMNNELGGFIDVSTTPTAGYCCAPFIGCLVELGGGTDTSFYSNYPGYLRFPMEYDYEPYGIGELVDYDFGWEEAITLICTSPWDHIHPTGLKDTEKRKEIYEAVLRHMILQDGIDELEKDAAEDIVKFLHPLYQALELNGHFTEARMILTIINNVGAASDKVKALRDAFDTISFTREQMRTISDIINAPNNFTGWGTKILKFSSKAGKVVAWVNLFAHLTEIPGAYLHHQLSIALMHAHGDEILENTIRRMQSIPDIDPALSEAINYTYAVLSDETLSIFYEEMGKEIAIAVLNSSLDAATIILDSATIAAGSTIVGLPAAAVVLTVRVSISLVRGGVSIILDKLEDERLQQAIVLFSSLEREWYDYPMHNFNNLDTTTPPVDDEIEEINWNVSSKLYQALFVTSELFENTGLMKRIFLGGVVSERHNKAETYRNDLIKVILGLGAQTSLAEIAWSGDQNITLGRFAGRPTYNGTYIGFVPLGELAHLVRLANHPEEVFSNYGLKYILYSPGDIGVIDPVGRRIGTFVYDDGTGSLVSFDKNEIPGATYSGSNSHPREIFIPRPITGNCSIRLVGTNTGPYTLVVQEISAANEVVSEHQTTGMFEPGLRADGIIAIDKTVVQITSPPVPRGGIIGNVLDIHTGNPIEGARVTVNLTSDITGSDGSFEIENIIPGTFHITATATNYEGYRSEEITLVSGTTLTYNIELVPFDSDNDGIPDDTDDCPESNLGETITIDGCDSGVNNKFFDNGCTMSDLIAECEDDVNNHGNFVSCVSHLTNDWKKQGLMNGNEKGAILRCIANTLELIISYLNDAIELENEAEANMMVGDIEYLKQLINDSKDSLKYALNEFNEAWSNGELKQLSKKEALWAWLSLKSARELDELAIKTLRRDTKQNRKIALRLIQSALYFKQYVVDILEK